MRTTSSRIRAAMLTAAAAIALVPPGGASAQDVVAAKAERSNPRAYWTEERMREAVPAEVRLPGEPAIGAVPSPPAGPPVAVAPAPAGGGGAAIRAAVIGEPETQGHGPFQRVELSNTTSFPNRIHGKVFFTIPGQGKFVCSGTVVNSRNRSTVILAGHCVFDHEDSNPPAFVTNLIFVPGYRDGATPFGEWPARKLFATDRWASNEDLRYDAGAAVLGRNANGEGIQDLLGARGIAFNQPRSQAYQSYGYPAGFPFDGERLHRCDSQFAGSDPSFPSPRPMRIDCDFTGGSSGGGWVIGQSHVVGVNSYKYTLEPDHMYGPYFGDEVLALYRNARGRKLTCQGERVTHFGTKGPDTITGTNRRDVIRTRGGDDVVRANKGNDLVCAGAGDDTVKGRAGLDRLRGGAGDDILSGGGGRHDLCVGGAGGDRGPRCERRRSIP